MPGELRIRNKKYKQHDFLCPWSIKLGNPLVPVRLWQGRGNMERV